MEDKQKRIEELQLNITEFQDFLKFQLENKSKLETILSPERYAHYIDMLKSEIHKMQDELFQLDGSDALLNHETAIFAEQLRKDRDAASRNLEDFKEELASMEPDHELREVYESLAEKASQDIVGYNGMIHEVTSNQANYTQEGQTLAAMEAAYNDPTYWEGLMAQAQNQEDVAYLEDVMMLRDSTADAVRFAEQDYAEFLKAEEAADAAAKYAEAALTQEGLSQAYDAVQSGMPVTENMPKEMKDAVEKANAEMADWRNSFPKENLSAARDAAADALLQQQIAKHPIRYAISNMRQTCSDIHAARVAMNLSMSNYLKTLAGAVAAYKTKVGEKMEGIKDSVQETARNALISAGTILNNAATGLSDLARKGKDTLVSFTRGCVKFADKTLDACTLGGWAKMNAALDKASEKLQKSKEAHPVLAKITFPLGVAAKVIDKTDDALRGTDKQAYWKDVTDNGFFWGNVTNEQGQADYRRSPVQVVADSVHKAFDKGTEVAKGVADKAQTAWVNVKADSMEFKADVYEKLSNAYAKNERRMEAKISRLDSVNKEWGALAIQMERAFQKTGNQIEIHKRQEYEPNPDIVKQQKVLETMKPGKEKDFVTQTLEAEMKKDKRDFQITQTMEQGKAVIAKAEANAAKIMRDDAIAVIDKNLGRMDRVEKKISASRDRAGDALSKADDLRIKAQELRDGKAQPSGHEVKGDDAGPERD